MIVLPLYSSLLARVLLQENPERDSLPSFLSLEFLMSPSLLTPTIKFLLLILNLAEHLHCDFLSTSIFQFLLSHT